MSFRQAETPTVAAANGRRNPRNPGGWRPTTERALEPLVLPGWLLRPRRLWGGGVPAGSAAAPGLVAVGILKVRLDESGPKPLETWRGMSVLGFFIRGYRIRASPLHTQYNASARV
jgi:hypothetical protein